MSTHEQIQHTTSSTELQGHLRRGEILLWSGRPDPRPIFTLLRVGRESNNIIRTLQLFGVLLLIAIFVLGKRVDLAMHWLLLGALLINLLIFALTDGLMNLRKKHTRYGFSKNRVFFQLWRWGKREIHAIDLKEFYRFSYEKYSTREGIVHLIPHERQNFQTYDFYGGERRFHPTFELIQDADQLSHQLEELRRARMAYLAQWKKT